MSNDKNDSIFHNIEASMKARLGYAKNYLSKTLPKNSQCISSDIDRIEKTADLRSFLDPNRTDAASLPSQMSEDIKTTEERLKAIPIISNVALLNTCIYSLRVLIDNWCDFPYNPFEKDLLTRVNVSLKQIEENPPSLELHERLLLFSYNEYVLAVPPTYRASSVEFTFSRQWMDTIVSYFSFLENLTNKR